MRFKKDNKSYFYLYLILRSNHKNICIFRGIYLVSIKTATWFFMECLSFIFLGNCASYSKGKVNQADQRLPYVSVLWFLYVMAELTYQPYFKCCN